jgi:hypothetical protein
MGASAPAVATPASEAGSVELSGCRSNSNKNATVYRGIFITAFIAKSNQVGR